MSGELQQAGLDEIVQGLIILAFVFGPIIKRVIDAAAAKKAAGSPDRGAAPDRPQRARPQWTPPPDGDEDAPAQGGVTWADLMAGRVPEPVAAPKPIPAPVPETSRVQVEEHLSEPLGAEFPTLVSESVEPALSDLGAEDVLEAQGGSQAFTPLAEFASERDQEALTSEPVARSDAYRARAPQEAGVHAVRGSLRRASSWKRAVVLSELLGTPIALRTDSGPRGPYLTHH